MDMNSFSIQIPGVAVVQRVTDNRDAPYINPDGNPVEAPVGTTFVELELSPAPGSLVRVEVALPEPARWNGRLVGLGNGGGGGWLPSKEQAHFLADGFATATTDLGTKRDPLHAGIDNPEVWRDYGHRATHLTMVAGKEAVRAAYGRAPEFTYFVGGSTGGQQALSLAQRHPEDCDGILAAVPAHCRTPLHAYFLWNWQATHRPDGSPLFTKEQEASYRATVLELLSPRETFPHARGRFLAEPRWDAALRAEALRRAAARDPSLTPAHLDALRRLQDGPVHARTGERIFDGLPPATDFEPACGNLYLLHWIFGADADLMGIDFDRDIDRYFAALGPDLNAEDTDLDAFRACGGKLLMYSGTADSCVPYTATLDYYERVIERLGGDVGAVQDFFLFYLLPGRKHSGGPGVQGIQNDFKLLVNWREKGVKPQATGFACTTPTFQVPLHPYPQTTAPDGSPAPFPRSGVARVAPRFRHTGGAAGGQ